MGAINNNRVSSIDVVRDWPWWLWRLTIFAIIFTLQPIHMIRWIWQLPVRACLWHAGLPILCSSLCVVVWYFDLLQGQRKSTTELASFLVKGDFGWCLQKYLLFLGWTFNPAYEIIPFPGNMGHWYEHDYHGYIGVLKVPTQWMVMMGLVIVMGHNVFDFVEDDPGFQATPWWDFLHYGFLPPMKFCRDTMLCWSTPFRYGRVWCCWAMGWDSGL